MNQSINTDIKNSKEPQQKYRLGTVSIKILGGLNRFYRRLTSPSASIMAQNIQLFGPRGGFLTHQCSRLTRSCWRISDSEIEFIARYIAVSSANNLTRDLTWSGMSLMYVRNNNGPRTESCGIPEI